MDSELEGNLNWQKAWFLVCLQYSSFAMQNDSCRKDLLVKVDDALAPACGKKVCHQMQMQVLQVGGILAV